MMRDLDLPTPPDELLQRSPLALVVWQVRFDRQLVLATTDAALQLTQQFHEVGTAMTLKELSEVTVSFGANPGQSSQATGWRAQNDDKTTTVLMTPELLTVETSDYGRWDTVFRPTLETALDALLSLCAPKLENRLGLRYVDRMPGEGRASPSEWESALAEHTLGGAADPQIQQSVIASETALAVRVDRETTAKVRTATFPEGKECTAVVDVDVSREASRGFDREGILQASENYRRTCKQLFRWSIRDDFYDHLRGDNDSASDRA